MEYKKWTQAIEKRLTECNQRTDNNCNRPYYPTIILFNRPQPQSRVERFSYQIERIWSQSASYLIRYSYQMKNTLEFFDEMNGIPVSHEVFLQDIDRAKQAHGYFRSMSNIAVYNVLDTSDLDSIEEFEADYQLLQDLRSMISDAHRSMLIVLLNDSASHRETADKIRDFLSTHNDYESTLVLANRMRNHEEYDMDFLYRILPDIILATNNDTVSSTDRSYERAIAKLYENSTQTIAYLSKEKPNERIALQIGSAILENLCEKISKQPIPFSDLIEKLEIKNGVDLPVCQKFFEYIHLNPNHRNSDGKTISLKSLAFLPMRSSAIKSKIRLETITYKELLQYTYADVVQKLAKNSSKQILSNIDMSEYRNEVEKYLTDKLSVFDLARITEEDINKVIEGLYLGSISENSIILNYFEDSIREALRREYLYPQFKEIFLSLRQRAADTTKSLTALQQDYQRNMPPYLEKEIGKYYRNLVHEFLNREKTPRYTEFLCQPGSNSEAIMDTILQCCYDFIESHREIFSLPFVDEWEQRLNMVGDRVYKEITQAVANDLDDQIMLCGNYPMETKLQVFMFHTKDETNDTDTKLYDYLSNSFANNSSVLYVNSGCDDFLSSLLFVPCDGNNLII